MLKKNLSDVKLTIFYEKTVFLYIFINFFVNKDFLDTLPKRRPNINFFVK